MVTHARDTLLGLNIPVWGGQFTQRANFMLALAEGDGAREYEVDSVAAAEIGRLWGAIEKSVKVTNVTSQSAQVIHGARDTAATLPRCTASRPRASLADLNTDRTAE